MRRLGKLLVPLLLVGACAGRGRAVVIANNTTNVRVHDNAPPPAREEVVVYRPGMVWVSGHWDRDGGSWVWKDGYHEAERPGYVYIEGRWQPSARGYVWVDGGWRKREGIAMRERRFRF